MSKKEKGEHPLGVFALRLYRCARGLAHRVRYSNVALLLWLLRLVRLVRRRRCRRERRHLDRLLGLVRLVRLRRCRRKRRHLHDLRGLCGLCAFGDLMIETTCTVFCGLCGLCALGAFTTGTTETSLAGLWGLCGGSCFTTGTTVTCFCGLCGLCTCCARAGRARNAAPAMLPNIQPTGLSQLLISSMSPLLRLCSSLRDVLPKPCSTLGKSLLPQVRSLCQVDFA